MKVILLRDVAKLGKRFSIVEVPDGYALNKLVPQGHALPATPENSKKVKAMNDKKSADSARSLESFKKDVEQLKTKELTLKVEANKQEHLFKSIKSSDLSVFFKDNLADIRPENIILDEPIKSLGLYEIKVAQGEVKDIIKINIVAK